MSKTAEEHFLPPQLSMRMDKKCRRGETKAQLFHMLSMCLMGLLFLVVVHRVFLFILGVFGYGRTPLSGG